MFQQNTSIWAREASMPVACDVPLGSFGSRPRFEAVCTKCGKATTLPFQPTRPPTYCIDCFREERGSRPARRFGRWIELLYAEVVQRFTGELATRIASDPRFLDHVEWRELERVLGAAFEGFGFKILVTRSAKDGGKDIVLECNSRGRLKIYYVEIKHWRSGKRVGAAPMREFVSVVFRDEANGGLMLSTSGYSKGAYESLSVIERKKVRISARVDVVRICQTYTQMRSGVWLRPTDLGVILFGPEVQDHPA